MTLKLAINSLEVCLHSEWSFFFLSVWLLFNTHSRVYAISSKIFPDTLKSLLLVYQSVFISGAKAIFTILHFIYINFVSALFQLPINIFS